MTAGRPREISELCDPPPGLEPAQWVIYLAVRFQVPTEWRVSTTVNERGEVVVWCRKKEHLLVMGSPSATGMPAYWVVRVASWMARKFEAGIDESLYLPRT